MDGSLDHLAHLRPLPDLRRAIRLSTPTGRRDDERQLAPVDALVGAWSGRISRFRAGLLLDRGALGRGSASAMPPFHFRGRPCRPQSEFRLCLEYSWGGSWQPRHRLCPDPVSWHSSDCCMHEPCLGVGGTSPLFCYW